MPTIPANFPLAEAQRMDKLVPEGGSCPLAFYSAIRKAIMRMLFTRCDKVVPGLGTTNLLPLLLLLRQLFNNFLTTFWQFLDNFVTIFLSIFWQLYNNLWTTFWQLLTTFSTILSWDHLPLLTVSEFLFPSILAYTFSLSLHPNCRNWSPNYSVLVFDGHTYYKFRK
jgi:hypothetical protein